MKKLNRKRKTKVPCQTCYLHMDLCLCSLIPSIDLATKVSLVIHHRELKRTTNTGRLAMKALINSEMRIRGLESGAVDLSDLISDEYETFVLFPAENSTLLTEEFVKGIKKKIQLIVPDGNWRQASKVCTRQKELSQIKRVMVSRSSKDPYHMRAESSENGMATLQSIAHALGIIEGDEVKKQLLKLYNEKLVRTLVGRGQLSPKELELN